ncbi:hypothetical protein B0H13DRAFT_1629698, partial [Mycena leptocephala]
IQRLFNKEDKLLREEGAALRAHMFTCGMCLETYPEDCVARVPGCAHEFCRVCMYKYVDSKLTERILPTFCPGCAAIDARDRPGFITSDLVRTLGLNDDQYRIFQELELAPLFTFLECLKCKEPMFADREEFAAAVFLACPIEGCNHAWCRRCGTTIIDLTAREHECAGEAQLVNLMSRKGWKRCPTCKTPYEKTDGCYHMKCPSPGCLTHFCYKCGQLIVRAARAREIDEARANHYRRDCDLVEHDAT